MKILGIETTTQRASIAVVEGDALIAEANLPDGERHSTSLLPALDNLLKACGVRLKELSGIAVGIGPGSFTGIRLGLATARGLSLSLNIPIRGVCCFDNLVSTYEGAASRICPLVNAHSYGFYTALYARESCSFTRIREPFVCRPQELAEMVEGEVFFIGPHLSMFREALGRAFGSRASSDESDRFPAASTAARLYGSPFALRDDPLGAVAPLYILPGVRVKSAKRS
jgi:tRNA threonylcarbamoyladenosine biosynthesis protein TsaB